MASSKLEFMVENIGDSKELKDTLLKLPDISHAEVFKNEIVVVETVLPCSVAGELIQQITGSRAVLQGFGEGGTAVAMMEGILSKGIIRLSGGANDSGLIDGTIDGLPPGKHNLNVHVAGDISQGCDSLGPIWKPAGELGNITAESNGRATFKFIVPGLKIKELVGRSLAIATEDYSKKLVCGVIARSAGLFENSKKICACDGVTLWDERNVPAAGKGRRHNDALNGNNQKHKL